ncbi:MAG: dihydroorotate dehydrogenase [Candidatus Micrarchaeota archaeon]|nr:dihydroorotate dehydrogenase [Candidatus Micrarchaeota archaeon]
MSKIKNSGNLNDDKLSVVLSKDLCLKNPCILASGINDISVSLLKEAEKKGVGCVTTKSCNLNGRIGYKNPTMACRGKYFLNAIGLSNPGAEKEAEKIRKAKKELTIPIIASVFGESDSELKKVVEVITSAEPNAIEVDLSCPHAGNINLFEDLEALSSSLDAVVTATDLPVFAKVSPAMTIKRLHKVVKLIEEKKFTGITAINTMPAMLIDIEARAPILSNRVGGLSGYCLKPIALRYVYEIRRISKLKIIGTGGIFDYKDAVEMLLAGADAIGIGTATYQGFEVFGKINKGILNYMKKKSLTNISQIKLDSKWFV